MKQDALIEKLKESLFESSSDVGLTTVLNELEGWDSLGRLSVVALLQESFGVIVETKTLKNLNSIGDIVNLVKEKLEV